MRQVFTRTWLQKWALPLAAAGVAIAVVLAAPLASPNRASARVEISGASSLSDSVSVTYAVKPPKPEKPDRPTTPEPAAVHEQATSSLPPAGSIHAAAAGQVAGSVPAAGSVQAAATGQAASSVQAATSVQAAGSDKPDKPEKPEKPEKPPKAGTTEVHLLAFNDLHGNLQPASLNIYGKYAGGAAFLAKAVKDRQALYGDYQATVLAGDNIGASPLENGLFFEEPITVASNLMNVDFASVGNHEFDKGAAELRRIQNGGCHPVEGCTAAPYALANGRTTSTYPGADFQYLSANVFVTATGRTLFPAYATKSFTAESGKSFQVGFIGEVLESTPTIVTPTGVAGLSFEDEADSANAVVRNKTTKTVGTWVLVIHEGGIQTTPPTITQPNNCQGQLAGSAIANIASRLDPRIKVIVSAHTHAEYRCTITSNGVTRLITSASSFGRILSDITLEIDDKSGELVAASAQNIIVENATNAPPAARVGDPSKADPQVQAVVDQYVTASAPLANEVIGTIQTDLTRTGSPFGESTLGNVIADAQLAATAPAGFGNAVIAFMNPGGIRADFTFNQSSGGEAPGKVTYGEAFTVQPFGNSLVTKTMTGDMIRRLLQQQFHVGGVPCNGGTVITGMRVLQVSSTFKYESAPTAATCAGKIGKMWVNGVEVTAAMSFRVTMNSFLAAGGDGFTVFNEGTDALGGDVDIDALVDYFASKEPAGIPTPPLNRIVPVP